VRDVDTLAEMVRDGRIDADTRVRVPGREGWALASEVPELAELFVDDPWAAWEASDEPVVENDELGELPAGALTPASEPVPELPVDAVKVVPEGRREKGRFVIDGPRRAKASLPKPSSPPAGAAPAGFGPATSPASRVSTPVAPPRAAASAAGGLDNVIAFPSPLGPATLGPHALAPLQDDPRLDIPVLRVPSAIEPRSGPRWGMLVLVALCAFGLVGAVNAWVRHVAGQTFVPAARPTAAVASPASAAPPVSDPTPAPTPSADLDELTVLDQELRGRMRSEIGVVAKTSDLESALFVDLSRMGLADLRIDASVTSWSGKKNDLPRSAEIQVGFKSRPGELDRELAAVGLIVGRYIQSYGLDVARFEVLLDAGDEVVRRWPIDPSQARNYYIQRVSLPSFLTNMRKQGGR